MRSATRPCLCVPIWSEASTGEWVARPGSFVFWRYRNERRSSRRAQRCRCRNSVRRDNAVRASGDKGGFTDEAALPWMQSRDALDLSQMGVCAFARSVWRPHGGVASVLWAGGLRDARFQPEAAAGEASFLEAGGEACRWLPSGGRLHGGCALPSGGRSVGMSPMGRVRLAGIGPAGGLRSSRMAQGRSSFLRAGGGSDEAQRPECCRSPSSWRPQRGARPAARSGSAAVAGQPRSRTEGRRGGPLGWRPQQGCRSARRTDARGGDIGAGGAALEVAFSPEAATRVLERPRQHLRRRGGPHRARKPPPFSARPVCV